MTNEDLVEMEKMTDQMAEEAGLTKPSVTFEVKVPHPWTEFMDMHSGGGQKEKFAHCYIQAPLAEAEIIFQNRFGHNPSRVSCSCCGADYSTYESDTLEEATAYRRNCRWATDPQGENGYYVEGNGKPKKGYVVKSDFVRGKYIPLSKYVKQKDVMVVYVEDIKDSEREGELRKEGWVWA